MSVLFICLAFKKTFFKKRGHLIVENVCVAIFFYVYIVATAVGKQQ